MLVTLTGSKGSLASSDYDQTLNVAAGSAVSVNITPPLGELWRVKGLYLRVLAPTGATTGTHYLGVRMGDADRGEVLRGTTAHNKLLYMIDNSWFTDVDTKAPSDQANAVRNLVCSNAVPLSVRYSNNTDALQNQALWIRVIREVEYIV